MDTFSAADTLRRIGGLYRVNGMGAGLLTGAALGTGRSVHLIAKQGDPVEKTVKRPQGTEIPAEGTIAPKGQNKDGDEQKHLPAEQKAEACTERLIGGDQRDAGHQCSRRTDVFAEPRIPLAACAGDQRRKQKDKQNENHIFQVFQYPVAGQYLSLLKEWDFVEEILYPAEGT